MNGVLVLNRIRVQGANAVAGSTWGFPAISAFLGFCHALDRVMRPPDRSGENLFGGCAIVCHDHQPLTLSHFGEHRFSQVRAPLTRQGKTAPFNEEGRMHMTVSLLVEVGDGIDDYLDSMPDAEREREGQSERRWFADRVMQMVPRMRLAGGTVLDIESARYERDAGQEGDPKKDRKVLFDCLPGFALIDRSEMLQAHLEASRTNDPSLSMLDAWMDFAGLRFRAGSADEIGHADWSRVALSEIGWFIPLMVGYQGIAPLAEAGTVPGTRDPSVPFHLVESVYGVGQWVSPHRIGSIERLLWRYGNCDENRYTFDNHPHDDQPSKETTA